MAVVVFVPSRIGGGDFTDLPAPTAGDDAKAITYDHDTGAFVYAAASATPPGSDTQLIFNDGGAYGADAGLTYAKATDRLTVAGGLVAPSMRPASDSTTALQWQNAAGTAVVTVDTTNSRASVAGRLTPAALFLTGTWDGTTYSVANSTGITFDNQPNTFWSGINWTGTNIIHNARTSHIFRVTGTQILQLTATQFVVASTISMRARDFQSEGTWDGTTYPPQNSFSLDPEPSSTFWAGIAKLSADNYYQAATSGKHYFRTVDTSITLAARLKSSTTENQDAGRIIFKWGDATHATRSSIGQVSAFYIATEHFPITWGASSAGPLLSFGAVTTPIATPVLATGASATPDDIIAVLQSYGLVKQS